IQEVIEIAKEIKSERYRSGALSFIAEALAKISADKKDLDLIQEVIEIAKEIKSERYRSKPISKIAEVLAKIGADKKLVRC
ncbi:MAG: hypothetical protein ACE5J3_10435, partial [Methanosarcinales archaeon]